MFTITTSGGQFLRNGAPLIPLSDTIFSPGGSDQIQFFIDDRGLPTCFTVELAEGEYKAIRKVEVDLERETGIEPATFSLGK